MSFARGYAPDKIQKRPPFAQSGRGGYREKPMNQPKKERFKTSVGGQALMEGIMMRGPKQMCCAVRKPDGTIETKLDPTPTHGVWTKIPLVRGAISMVESMIVGYRLSLIHI